MSKTTLGDLFSSNDDSEPTRSVGDGAQLFDHISTRKVTYDKTSHVTRFSTSKDEDMCFNMEKGDDAHIFKISEDTMLVRFE